MRAALNAVYRGSGVLAGFFLVAIGVMSLIQVVSRQLGFAAHSYDEFAGYCMAASSFLGLAWTLRCNEQIRMTIILSMAKGGPRRALEIVCLALAIFMVGYFAWASVAMVWTSYSLNDVSQGLVPITLWIPQSGMALGLVILLLAFVDDLLVVLTGGTPSYQAAETADADNNPRFER
ncbi:MAG: TRAP transporter small permease [Betaproteobacteria bacterium]|nr:TRAP transporter small permease [Betaproteobacteria bacterium]